eukprot:CAMPEP_0119518424 /NCGR_PEP_ID=MMETSP1344-20130328/35035_1 /TAXON_ID=236787 /ORGANISM="Florenciella parvula, Strain CCMP2471" /LENGTH=58 /DNA_ID=CAMNT_0007556109 /DNA_START=594 /DNA_END=770 /DNA_ORIENTATION=-
MLRPPSSAVSLASVSASNMRPAVFTSARPLTRPPVSTEPASAATEALMKPPIELPATM